MKLKDRYDLNKKAKIGDGCLCPSCNSKFIKSSYQQVFCKMKGGTICKDKYWNTVTPEKRNNTTRISPASARWMKKQPGYRKRSYNPDDHEHPFSSEALGQWDD